MSDCYVGEIRMFAGNYAPYHWAFCYGQLLSIAEFSALFSLIGTAYGGDGRSSFGLPDMRGRIPVNQGQGPGLTNKIMGQMYGVEEVTLDVTELPTHTHQLQGTTNPATTDSPQGAVPASVEGNGSFYTNDLSAPEMMAANLVQSAGGDVSGGTAPHINMMPSLGLNFIIALQGTYPQRN